MVLARLCSKTIERVTKYSYRTVFSFNMFQYTINFFILTSDESDKIHQLDEMQGQQTKSENNALRNNCDNLMYRLFYKRERERERNMERKENN